jgi:hypothetical protein
MGFFDNLRGLLQDAKLRAVLVLVIIVVIIGALIGYAKLRLSGRQDNPGNTANQQISVAQSGKDLKFQPGVDVKNPQLEKTIRTADTKGVQQAEQQLGSSYIPSLTSQIPSDCQEEYDKLRKAFEAQQAANEKMQNALQKTQQAIRNMQQQMQAAANKLAAEKQRNAALMANSPQGVIPAGALKVTPEEINNALNQLGTEKGGALGTILPTTMEVKAGKYQPTIIDTSELDNPNMADTKVPADLLKKLEAQGAIDPAALKGKKVITFGDLKSALADKVIGKAGDVLFGVIENTVNSDNASIVFAKITSGPLKGSKLLGNFTPNQNYDKLALTFTTISMPNATRTYAFNGVAIDPDTAEASMATDVNHHYLLRYGTFFAATFLEGLMDALKTEKSRILGSGININVGDNSQSDYSSKDQVLFALGKVGERFNQQLAPIVNKKPTVVVQAGTPVGILLMQDSVFGKPPTKQPSGALFANSTQRPAVDTTGKTHVANQRSLATNKVQDAITTIEKTLPLTNNVQGEKVGA